MTGGRLPDGVPFDNQKLLNSAKSADPASISGEFKAPDMATPAFARPAGATHAKTGSIVGEGETSQRLARVIVAIEDDDDDDDDRDDENADDQDDVLVHGPHAPAPLLILIAIAFVLAALAAYVLSRNQEPQPYCSQLPEWNRYNCIPG